MKSNSVIVLPSRGKAGNSNRVGWKDYVNRQYANAKKRKAIVAKLIASEPINVDSTRCAVNVSVSDIL